MLQNDALAVEVQLGLLGKSLLRQSVRRRWIEMDVESSDFLWSRKPQPRILVSQNRSARLVEPLISVGVIEVPVSVDQQLKWLVSD